MVVTISAGHSEFGKLSLHNEIQSLKFQLSNLKCEIKKFE